MGKPQTTFKKRLKEMKRKDKYEKKQLRRSVKKGVTPEEPIDRKIITQEPDTPMIQLGSEEAKALLTEKKKGQL